MKILFVITGMGMGGAENQVALLVDKLSLLGHDVQLVSLIGSSIVTPKVNIPVHLLKLGKDPFSIFTTAKKLRAIVNTFKPDVVHSHMIHANLMCRLVKPVCKMEKLICTAHSTQEGGRILSFLYRITNPLCDVFTNVSKLAVKEFERNKVVKKNTMLCVYNGIDLDKFAYSESDRKKLRNELELGDLKTFIAVGRFNPEKNYPLLIKSFHRVQQRYPNTSLIIVGDGPDRGTILELISTLNLKSKVKLLGVRRDVPSLLSASDFFVLSSKWEGFGLVVAEAMSCKINVLATDCGGVAEVLGGNGTLIDVNDEIQMESGMKRLLEVDEVALKEDREKAYFFISQHFSINKQIERWLAIYRQ